MLIDAKSTKKTEVEKRVIRKKLKSQIEFEERLKTVKPFMDKWNKWREFYYGLDPIEPKTKSQLTQIENIIEWAGNKNISTDILCAVVHRAHIKKSFRPSFSTVVVYGEEWLDRFEIEVENALAEARALEERENRNSYYESH